MPDSNVMFAGGWISNTVTVIFNGNGGLPPIVPPTTEPPTTVIPPVESPKTGDKGTVSFWLIPMGISLAGIWIIIRHESKKATR